jgi:hypothetical protein
MNGDLSVIKFNGIVMTPSRPKGRGFYAGVSGVSPQVRD